MTIEKRLEKLETYAYALAILKKLDGMSDEEVTAAHTAAVERHGDLGKEPLGLDRLVQSVLHKWWFLWIEDGIDEPGNTA